MMQPMEAVQPGGGFAPVDACWVCGARALAPVARAIFEFEGYREQDPGLTAYTGATVDLVRCGECGFGQPRAMPTLPDYFGRMYDQRWSDEWIDSEFHSTAKDAIFREVLRDLAARVPAGERTLLDLGAHVGRFIHLAAREGWRAEGVELNPRTSAYAARATGLPVHRADLRDLAEEGRRYTAVTLTDVLEHIPEPVGALQAVRRVVAPGGWVAVKVPHGPNQLRKELLRARLRPGYRPTVADNLVHVSHFTPRALAIALERAGFVDVQVRPAAPELFGSRPSRAGRLAAYAASRALGPSSPLALNLQAYARAGE
jgi:SAM-dependent methyltransferase